LRQIAGAFDLAALQELPYTHAGAYLRDGRFSLVACVEPTRIVEELSWMIGACQLVFRR